MVQDELPRATLSQLLNLQTDLAAEAASLKGRSDALKAELASRFAESARRALEQKGKEYGSGSLPLQDGLRAKFKVDQEIKWDSDALMAVAQGLPWETVNAIFKIAFSVPETIYKGIASLRPELRERIDAARTTKIKPATITLEKDAPLA